MKLILFYNNISINRTWGNINRRAVAIEYLPACLQSLQSILYPAPHGSFYQCDRLFLHLLVFPLPKKKSICARGSRYWFQLGTAYYRDSLTDGGRKIILYTASLWSSLELNPGQRRHYEGRSESAFTRHIFRGFSFRSLTCKVQRNSTVIQLLLVSLRKNSDIYLKADEFFYSLSLIFVFFSLGPFFQSSSHIDLSCLHDKP
jgi:hypothetical protein